jgi:transposase
MEAHHLAKAKKKAKRKGQTIVFIDESGLSERPFVMRTWAPRGETPVLQHHFSWKQLAAIAGVSWYNIYFKLYPGTIKQEQVVDFLRHLMRLLRGNILVVWDGLRSHKGRLVRKFIEVKQGRLEVAFLPAYAPQLNPVEYLWGYWKMRELPNFCAEDYRQLSVTALDALKRIRKRRSTLVAAFWKQAELAL